MGGAISEKNYLGASGEIERLSSAEKPAEKLKRPAPDEYLFRNDPHARWECYRVEMQQRLRTRVPNQETPDQALFSNEEIAEKTAFVSDILVTDSQAAQSLMQGLQLAMQHWLRMGRGGRPLQIEQLLWLGSEHPEQDAQPSEFILLCESDVILRDEWLRYQTKFSPADLARWLGKENLKVSSKQQDSYFDHRQVFGFNATSGLPRPVQIAIMAGSALRISGEDAPELYCELAHRLTIGEFAEEGFGRFSLNQMPQPTIAQTDVTELSQLSQPANNLCQQARKWAKNFNNLQKISDSQLGEFRNRVQAIQSATELAALFAGIQAAAEKHGGKNWKSLTSKSEYVSFRQSLLDIPVHEAQDLLNDFVRWCRVGRQSSIPPRENQE